MRWTNSQLHEFEIGGRQYGEIDDDAPEELLEEDSCWLRWLVRGNRTSQAQPGTDAFNGSV
jgi:hypothetical protein